MLVIMYLVPFSGDCDGTDKKCNCDVNDSENERDDTGYLENADDLPVTVLYYGDVGNPGERGFHTVGPLECFG